jgi:acyl-CoA synthetase (NDP forming)
MKHIRKFFYPSSICIVGASSKKESIGYELTNCVINYGFKGKIFLVNPNAEEILGIKCNRSIKEIKDNIDLVIVMVQKSFVEETIESILQKGIKAVILITAGFKETGKDGELLEKKISDKIRLHNARMVGPNCMGVINTLEGVKLNATFVAEEPLNGKMAFLSQSGAVGAAILNSLKETNIRFAHFISIGNKADINENDLISFWQEDDNIEVITMYLESFSNGELFIKKFIDNQITKPVIILKAGRTSGGIKAASSHTGALGSSDKVVDAILDQFGVIRVNNLTQLFNTAKGFENFPLPIGNRIAIVTNAGGPAILAVDSLEKNHLQLANISYSTKVKLTEIVHPEGSVNNPVDLLPGGTPDIYRKVNELILMDENVDAVISVFVEPVMVKAMNVVEKINEINAEKPLMQVVMPLSSFWEEYRKNSKTGKPLFRNPEDPPVVISNMLNYAGRKINLNRIATYKSGKAQLRDEPRMLNQEEVNKIVKQYNIPVIESRFIKYNELSYIDDFHYPLVLKAEGKGIIHKSELKCVRLNINNKDELIKSAEEMKSSLNIAGLNPERFIIQPFIVPRFELLVGGFRDVSFGPMVMFGTGGKYVEYLEDNSSGSAYICDDDIEKMINQTKIGKIISGVRGEEPVNIEALKSIIKNTAQMMVDNEMITECDINPLIVGPDNEFYSADIRIKYRE